MSNTPVSMFDIISNPHDISAIKTVQEELFAMNQEVKACMDKGLSAAEMTLVGQVREAVEAAERCFEKMLTR